MAKEKVLWVCTDCGHSEPKWAGVCSACKSWNTFVEEKIKPVSTGRISSIPDGASAVKISEVKSEPYPRISSGYGELDRLFGSGIVPGSLTLVGGDPGIGKSTLMLQLCSELAKQGKNVLYVCGEESVYQTSIRAKRLNISHDNISLLNETVFSNIQSHIKKLNPDIVVIDSIQIVYKSELSTLPGSVAQIKEVAMECMHIAKGMGITIFLIGHVTKTGELAGPRVLEHIVDTVLDFQGDQQHGFRILRSIKNRFGPTDEVAVFEMKTSGLVSLENPSQIFLGERVKEVTGSVIVPTVEGSRAILVEIQALVASSAFSTSSRRCAGIDQNRLALLLAVLEKKMGYHFHAMDVFVSIAGGLKISEPAIDLGILISLASSFCSQAIGSDVIVIGEVGLSGEVRSVPRIESRLKEAVHMGFKRCLLPKKCVKGIDKTLKESIELKPVELVEEAINALII